MVERRLSTNWRSERRRAVEIEMFPDAVVVASRQHVQRPTDDTCSEFSKSKSSAVVSPYARAQTVLAQSSPQCKEQ